MKNASAACPHIAPHADKWLPLAAVRPGGKPKAAAEPKRATVPEQEPVLRAGPRDERTECPGLCMIPRNGPAKGFPAGMHLPETAWRTGTVAPDPLPALESGLVLGCTRTRMHEARPVPPRGSEMEETRILDTRSATLVVFLAVFVFLPFLAFPLVGDDFYSVQQAAVTLKDPGGLLDPWMGGAFRLLPKLIFMGGFIVWGTNPAAYRLLAILIHGLSTFLVASLACGWSRSRGAGFWTALLFAVGFGCYAKPIVQISNLTMQLGLFLTLLALILHRRGNRRGALAFFLLAILSHELAVMTPLVVPFLSARSGREGYSADAHRVQEPSGERRLRIILLGFLATTIVLSLLPGRAGQLASKQIQAFAFMLLPINLTTMPLKLAQEVSIPRSLMVFVVGQRFWIGLVIVLLLMLRIRKADRTASLGLAWIFFFLVPSAWLMAGWAGNWMETRYLLIPSVGACFLASTLLLGLSPRRRTVRVLLLALLVASSLFTNSMVWRKYRWEITQPEWRHSQQEFLMQMQSLDPTGTP